MHVDIGFQRHIGHIGNVATPSARHAMKKAEPKHEPWLESAASPTRSQVPAKDPKINRSSWKDCLGRVPPLEKVYHSKDAFIFPTSSKCNGFDVANQTRRTSWVCGFLGRPWCEDPREYMTWHIAILINTPWTPWFWTLSETYRFQLWKNADVFLCLDFFLKSTPLYCSLKQEDPWEQGINTLDELCAGDGYCWRCTFVKFLWKCLCGCIVRV